MPEVGPLRAQILLRQGAFTLDADFSLNAHWNVLFGPSGAGKSTLLRVLSGLLRADRACITFGGEPLIDTGPSSSGRPVGFVMQQTALFPHMNVERNIAFGLRHLDGRARRERTGEILELVHAGHVRERMPAALSGGEQQRVALARALARHPRILLLDEPFSALDGALKDELLGELTAWLRAHQVLTLYVSHDAAEAFQTGAEVLLIEAGRICAQGSARQVLAAHRDRLLRQLGVGQ